MPGFNAIHLGVIRHLLLTLCIVTTLACERRSSPRTRLHVVAAASLSEALTAVSTAFTKAHPTVDVELEWVGSRIGCQYVLTGARAVDVLFVADAQLITSLLMPKDAAFNAVFARDALVLAYPSDGPVATALTRGVPWQKALQGMRTGYANPAVAPLGYRTLMALELNDRVAPEPLRLGQTLRAQLRPADARPDAGQLIAPLETGALDAAFLYRNEAQQHGFGIQELDPRINFGTPTHNSFYESVSVPGQLQPSVGRLIEYSVTVPRSAVHRFAAIDFVRFMLSAHGRAAIADHLSGFLPDAERRVEGQLP